MQVIQRPLQKNASYYNVGIIPGVIACIGLELFVNKI